MDAFAYKLNGIPHFTTVPYTSVPLAKRALRSPVGLLSVTQSVETDLLSPDSTALCGKQLFH